MISGIPFGLTLDDNNPLDTVAELATDKDWIAEKLNNNTLYLNIKSSQTEYTIQLDWQEEFQTIQISCVMDLKIAARQKSAAAEILMEVNNNVWLGHFDLPAADGAKPSYRYTMILQCIPESIAAEMITDIVSIATTECDRFYDMFSLLAADDIRTHDALSAAILETVGEA